ncbi:MAG: histidine phosphatase family protein [Clostridiales bacterium]|nr:histidine phosphatase family protein [Clostridiales bacterium]
MKKRNRLIQIGVVIVFCAALFYGAARQNKVVTIYFVRHGQTDTNVAGLLVGTSGNPSLTENGIQMALTLGEGLQDVSFDAAYASTLQRACDTAVLVLEGAGQSDLAVVTLDGLKDISWGDAEGMTPEELYETFGVTTTEESFGPVDDAAFVSPAGAETAYDFCSRFENAVASIVDASENGDIVLVVAHSSMDFYFEKYFPEQAGTGVDNCSVTVLRYDNGEAVLLEYNNVAYLQQ